MRLRSIVYKLIPGLYAKELHKSNELNGLLNGTKSLPTTTAKHHGEGCSEDEALSKQYFYDQDEPIR
jgi:hypothetical protein